MRLLYDKLYQHVAWMSLDGEIYGRFPSFEMLALFYFAAQVDLYNEDSI